MTEIGQIRKAKAIFHTVRMREHRAGRSERLRIQLRAHHNAIITSHGGQTSRVQTLLRILRPDAQKRETA